MRRIGEEAAVLDLPRPGAQELLQNMCSGSSGHDYTGLGIFLSQSLWVVKHETCVEGYTI